MFSIIACYSMTGAMGGAITSNRCSSTTMRSRVDIQNYLERASSNPFRHPKLDVFLNARETERNTKQYPTLLDYRRIIQDLDMHIACMIHIVSPKWSIEL